MTLTYPLLSFLHVIDLATLTYKLIVSRLMLNQYIQIDERLCIISHQLGGNDIDIVSSLNSKVGTAMMRVREIHGEDAYLAAGCVCKCRLKGAIHGECRPAIFWWFAGHLGLICRHLPFVFLHENAINRWHTCWVTFDVLVQHVALRLQSKPYMDEYIWETVLRKTDWITCLQLDHVSIAKELLPPEVEAQALLQSAVASGNIRLVSRMLQTFSGFPNMDIAAEADQFEMLKFLDGIDKSGTCICRATRRMAVHAATNCNQPMLEWLINNRLEAFGEGVFEAAAGTGSMPMLHWVLEQAKQGTMARIDSCRSHHALSKALQFGRMEMATYLIEHFSLHTNACVTACHVASLADLKQIWHAYYKYMAKDSWSRALFILVPRGDTAILSGLIEFVKDIGCSCFTITPVYPAECVLDIAAGNSFSLTACLYDHIPDELRARYVTDQTMTAAAGKGDLKLVNLSSSLSLLFTSFHATHDLLDRALQLQSLQSRLRLHCYNTTIYFSYIAENTFELPENRLMLPHEQLFHWNDNEASPQNCKELKQVCSTGTPLMPCDMCSPLKPDVGAMAVRQVSQQIVEAKSLRSSFQWASRAADSTR